MTKKKMIICIDFDGVIHAYSKGWQDGSIYDGVVPGFFVWAERAQEHFALVVYSSRSKTEVGRTDMRDWLLARAIDHYSGPAPQWIADIEFSAEKPPAYLTIDDRAVVFKGDWSDPALTIKSIWAFRPWNAPVKP